MNVSRREVLLNTLATLPVLATASVGAIGATRAADSKRMSVSPKRYQALSEQIFIPMRDGVKLAALMIRPENPEPETRFPALLTYDLYRGDADYQMGYYAERGYYGVYVGVRGTGMSGGRTTANEYSEQEGQDALDAIAWLAAQPWCNGKVGMFGTSYGGFNSIQTAMLSPPALKAIVPTFATDDVYTDDIVYYDGALQCESLGRWPFAMIASMGLPAPPDFNTDTAEAKYRVEQEPWIFEMLRHQTNDRFWQRMSLRPNYDALKIPTMMVGGWLDAYTDSVPRMLEKVKAPTRAVIGPWTHNIPLELPGPLIDIQHETLRWWDHWLKGINNGVMEEPRVALYVIHYYRPSLTLKNVPGEWRYEETWPVTRVRNSTWYPQPGEVLSTTREASLKRDLEYKPTVGMTNRYRCPHNSAELPVDQRPDDNYSMCFNTPAVEQDIEILGNPKAVLYVSSTAPVAYWIVRLCDVAPDGVSTLVSKGILNGTHYESHITPQALVPNRVYKLDINLKAMSWVFAKGHRIRIAISNADFPNLLPTPYSMSTSLHVDEEHPSLFLLPICPAVQRPIPDFKPPEEQAGPIDQEPHNEWTITRDEMAQTVTVFRETIDTGQGPIEGSSFERRWMTVSDAKPAEMKLVAQGQEQIKRGKDTLTCKSSMTIQSDEREFHITAKRELFVNDTLRYGKSWEDKIARKLV
jgi:uncharacterized protein